MKSKLLVICGPTAVGKTGLGIKLAKKFSGEIVSADSRQVYKGMDVGTGKDLSVNPKFEILNPKQIRNNKSQIPNYRIGYYEIGGIRVWLLDVVSPDYQFSVADYVRCANLVIKDIWKRGKLPILVGGTGFYIKGVVDGIGTMGIPQDKELREKLSNYPIIQLSNLLKKTDRERWGRMNKSDRRNPRRLIRAIEVAKQNQSSNSKNKNKSFALFQDFHLRGVHSATSEVVKAQNFCNKILFIGLTAPNEILYQRIDKRVDERVKQGVVEEIEALLKKGYSWENSVLGQTIGYKEWREYIKNAKSEARNPKLKEEVIQKWRYNEHGYARRQMTWFKKDKRISWFDILKKGWENKMEKLVNNWVSNFRPPSEESLLRQLADSGHLGGVFSLVS